MSTSMFSSVVAEHPSPPSTMMRDRPISLIIKFIALIGIIVTPIAIRITLPSIFFTLMWASIFALEWYRTL